MNGSGGGLRAGKEEVEWMWVAKWLADAQQL